MNWTNPLGSLTSLSVALAGLLKLMEQILGCVPGATDLSAVCSASWLSPQLAIYAGMIFGVGTLIGKLMRPGGIFSSLFGETAVVVPANSSKSGRGTVTPAQVASP